MTLNYKGTEYRPGCRVEAKINGEKVEGRLQYETQDGVGYFFICHNNDFHAGRYATNRFGYNFSWAFRPGYGGGVSDGVVIIGITKSDELKDTFEISDKLLTFFGNKKINCINLEYIDIFPEYDKFEVSENKGMIKLTNSTKNRVTEFKLGRFLNTFSKQYSEKFKSEPLFDNKTIEKIHNDYLSYQTGDYIKVEYLTGKDILEGYKKENYQIQKSSLGGSCMTDRLDYLDIYVNNADKVQMISIKMFDKFVGRALLWTTDCGKKVMDKQYICDEWVTSKFDEIRNENEYELWSDYGDKDNVLSISVNTDGIEQWPYLDTFQFLVYNKTTLKSGLFKTEEIKDKTKATLSTYPPKGYSMRLRSTSGRYEDCDWR
jgi:hypothetical protein